MNEEQKTSCAHDAQAPTANVGNAFGGGCPRCGYCPHCGRGGYAAPWNPWPYYPVYPWYTFQGAAQLMLEAGAGGGNPSITYMTVS